MPPSHSFDILKIHRSRYTVCFHIAHLVAIDRGKTIKPSVRGYSFPFVRASAKRWYRLWKIYILHHKHTLYIRMPWTMHGYARVQRQIAWSTPFFLSFVIPLCRRTIGLGSLYSGPFSFHYSSLVIVRISLFTAVYHGHCWFWALIHIVCDPPFNSTIVCQKANKKYLCCSFSASATGWKIWNRIIPVYVCFFFSCTY